MPYPLFWGKEASNNVIEGGVRIKERDEEESKWAKYLHNREKIKTNRV
jgi:hypothetical protein